MIKYKLTFTFDAVLIFDGTKIVKKSEMQMLNYYILHFFDAC